MKAFIDALDVIRIETNKKLNQVIVDDYHLTQINEINQTYYFKTDKKLALNKVNKISINNQDYPLEIGTVTLTDAFNEAYVYEGTLGAIYTKEKTIFRVFSPVAKAIKLYLADKLYEMTYQSSGIYEWEVLGDHDNKNYHFEVRLVDTFKKVFDPYAKASNLEGPVVVDFNKTQSLKTYQSPIKSYTEAVIYEAHVRDLTIDLDVKDKGLYQGLIEDSKRLNGSVIEYIKHLGITHLQLLPVYDFDDVFDDQKNLKYNWGYNPAQYFCLEGWYSKNPDDAYERISAFKDVISYSHDRGLAINMDVVYNHVFDRKTFPYDDLVPGYFYRHDANYVPTNNSYCGNDVETRHHMVRKLIIDSLVHFMEVYKIDGFRFDLMGLLDIKTMLDIEKTLKKINPQVMLYGEGWVMDNAVAPQERSHMKNSHLFSGYAHFNDDFRDTLRGSLHGTDLGYALGNNEKVSHVINLLSGSTHMFKHPSNTINYVECHDNYVFYDRMVRSIKPNTYYQDLATHLVLIARGIPFIHAGQEFYRSKQGDENSYNSSDEINKICWPKSTASIDKVRDLIKIRQQYDFYTKNEPFMKKQIKQDGEHITITLSNEKVTHHIYVSNHFNPYEIKEKGTIIFGNDLIKTPYTIDKPGVYIVEIIK